MSLPISQYHKDKKSRKDCYEQKTKGWKQRPCAACSGSGHYDSFGSPKCGACGGSGKEKYKPSHS